MAIMAECPVCHRKQTARNRVCNDCGKDLTKAKKAHKVRYWIAYRMPGGKQCREPVGFSAEEARASEGKRKAQKYENPKILHKVPEEKMTFQELAQWYLGLEKVKSKRYFPTLKIDLAKFNEYLGHLIVSRVKPIDIENYQARRKNEGYSDSYVDQHVVAAGSMINKAFDNDLVSGDTVKTFRRVGKLLKRNSNARDRIMSPGEVTELMKHLPAHSRAVVATGFYTGMRLGEILSLTWDKVDLQKRIIRLAAADTKDLEARVIPILPELLEVLRSLPRAIHDNHVFLSRGKPVGSIKASLVAACKKAGIVYGRFQQHGFVFHDLRHTFNTYMRKAGVPQSVIMKITGHSTDEMFRRYDTIDTDDAHQAVDRLRSFLESVDQNVGAALDEKKN